MSLVSHGAGASCISVKDVAANDTVINRGVGMSGKLDMKQENKCIWK